MSVVTNGKPWVCVAPSCGHVLGYLVGSELVPAVDGSFIITAGVNLRIRCPKCNSTKVFFTSDPLHRAINVVIESLASAITQRVVHLVSRELLPGRSANVDTSKEI